MRGGNRRFPLEASPLTIERFPKRRRNGLRAAGAAFSAPDEYVEKTRRLAMVFSLG